MIFEGDHIVLGLMSVMQQPMFVGLLVVHMLTLT